MTTREKVIAFIHRNRERYVQELLEFLRIPSVSAVSAHKKDILRAADFVSNQFRRMDFRVELHETPGHPIVYAEHLGRSGSPTVLVYGHYDVQPVDPLHLWRKPPFEPQLEGEDVVARGASDDKGQVLTHLKSAEAFVEAGGGPPINLKFIIEGEEEVGSDHLDQFLDANRGRLAADYAVISDTSQFAAGVPAITYGLKGLVYFQVDVKGSSQDLHSGGFGGTVSNPANVLAHLIARLRDESGRVSVPGFYDDVAPLAEWERKEFASLPFDEERYRAYIGAARLAGEPGYTTLERRWARPTLDVNGLWGGYSGEGAKTVIGAEAGAKISMRLVPDQDPEKIARLFETYVQQICPPTVELRLQQMHGAKPVVVPTDTPGMRAARRAIELGFGRPPVLIREGGTLPIVAALKEKLGLDVLLLGWGLPDDGAHSPNEKFSLADFHRGIATSAHLMAELA
ncbi:MAG: dipeptidase [Planctomycetes bacterium]|nr:dipeptidase [Planctomycetota bacterium]